MIPKQINFHKKILEEIRQQTVSEMVKGSRIKELKPISQYRIEIEQNKIIRIEKIRIKTKSKKK